MRTICLICMLCLAVVVKAASPIQGLLERIDKGASRKFVIEQVKSPTDFFELDQKGDKVVIRGNNYVSIATGVNWYLKYYAGIQLSWNGMTAQLPAVLPAVPQKERHEMTLIIVPIPIPWHFGTGIVGRRKLTGWHCMASIFLWQW